MKQLMGLAIVGLIFIGIWAVFSSLSGNRDGARRDLAETWITEESPTYLYDGSGLEYVSSAEGEGEISEYTFKFDSSSAGYGDRTGEVLAQVITPHVIVIEVEGSEVVSAVTDGVFNELTGEIIAGENEDPDTQETATLYFYKQNEDTDEDGNILCSSDAVLPVERVMEDYSIQNHFEALLAGPTAEEEASGFSSEFPLEGLTLEEVSGPDSDGVLTIIFDDPTGSTVGGSCRVTLLAAQIIETALTIPGVESVEVLPEDMFQP